MLEDPVEAPPLAGARRVHRLVQGTEFLGEYQGGGFREPKFLIRRSDGQVLQLPDLLYRVAGALDGRRDDAALAADLAAELGRELTAEQFCFLVEEKLRPVGIVVGDAADPGAGVPAAPVRSDPLLALRYRVGVVPERMVWRLAGPFRFLFRRPAWLAALAALLAVDVAIVAAGDLLDTSLRGVEQLVRHPELFLVLFVLTLLSVVFHEIGHVTGCRFGGARPGDMGVGVYLVWPAFYSTVTDAYRLDRVGRLRTDLGGVYFNAVFLVATGLLYLQTGQPWLLLALIGLHTETAWQFLPSIRLDGYYILGDLVGVPDLFGYILPALKSLLPGRPVHPRIRDLRPGPRRLIIGWVAVTVPLILGYLAAFLIILPHAVPVVVRELRTYLQLLEQHVRAGHVVETTVGVLQGFFLLVPWIGSAMATWMLLQWIASWSPRRRERRWGPGRVPSGTWGRVRRGAALAGVGALAALVVARVWQVGTSLPASPGELGLTDESLSGVAGAPGAADLLRAHVAVLGWLTGADGGDPGTLDGSRLLAVVCTAVLVTCLLLFAARRRVRLAVVTLPLLAALVMGPAVGALAGVNGAVVGAAWAAAGLLALTPTPRRAKHRPPRGAKHRRRRRPAGTAPGAAAVAVGILLCPLVAVPLAAGLAVVLARGTLGADRRAGPRWAAAVLLTAAAVLAALQADPLGGQLVTGPDRTVLLLAAGLVTVAGCAFRRLRPWAAAAALALLMGALPWPGAGAALPLVVVTAVPLAMLMTDALIGRPVADRPHPMVRAALAVPIGILVIVGALFTP
ncbi:hypothetical protein [Geodermatophilus sp. URMC 65]